MEDFSNIINWDNLFVKSEEFKQNKYFKFGFIEKFFNHDFYEKLYKTYPKIDDTWNINSDLSKFQYWKTWNNASSFEINSEGNDSSLSEYWNKFKRYAETDEFVENFKKFSGSNVTKLKHFKFMSSIHGESS